MTLTAITQIYPGSLFSDSDEIVEEGERSESVEEVESDIASDHDEELFISTRRRPLASSPRPRRRRRLIAASLSPTEHT